MISGIHYDVKTGTHVWVGVRVCVLCFMQAERDKGKPKHSSHAQSLQINMALSLETNSGPSHLWTCSSKSLIQVHFPLHHLCTLYTHTHAHTDSRHPHVRTNCHSLWQLVPLLKLWLGFGNKNGKNPHKHVSVRSVTVAAIHIHCRLWEILVNY